MLFSPRNGACPSRFDHHQLVKLSSHPSCSVRNLGVVMDRAMTMEKHVLAVSRTCYHQLRKHWHGSRRSLTTNSLTKSLVHGLKDHFSDWTTVMHRDYMVLQVSLITQTAKNDRTPLQESLTRTHRHEHITPVLADLHWLPVRRRVEFNEYSYTRSRLYTTMCTLVSQGFSASSTHPRRTL